MKIVFSIMLLLFNNSIVLQMWFFVVKYLNDNKSIRLYYVHGILFKQKICNIDRFHEIGGESTEQILT